MLHPRHPKQTLQGHRARLYRWIYTSAAQYICITLYFECLVLCSGPCRLGTNTDTPGPTAPSVLHQITTVAPSPGVATSTTPEWKSPVSTLCFCRRGSCNNAAGFSFVTSVEREESFSASSCNYCLQALSEHASHCQQWIRYTWPQAGKEAASAPCFEVQNEINRLGSWSPNLGSCWKCWTEVTFPTFLPARNYQHTLIFFHVWTFCSIFCYNSKLHVD